MSRCSRVVNFSRLPEIFKNAGLIETQATNVRPAGCDGREIEFVAQKSGRRSLPKLLTCRGY